MVKAQTDVADGERAVAEDRVEVVRVVVTGGFAEEGVAVVVIEASDVDAGRCFVREGSSLVLGVGCVL